MKRIKPLLLLCLGIGMLLVACGKKSKYMVDGPDMAYVPQWSEFILSRNDSSIQYSFWFKVTEQEDTVLVIGECNDENGNEYVDENGIELSEETIWQLRWMNLDKLETAVEWPEDLEMPLDSSEIRLTLVLSNGDVVEKNVSSDLSFQIYDLLLPYFKK